MTAFKLLLSDYEVDRGDQPSIPFRVRDSLCEVLMNPARKLNGPELLKAHALGQKILDAEGDFILLNQDEINALRSGIKAATGLGRAEVELVRRILEAEEVDVTEA